MLKGMEQLKKIEAPALAMARQALGRVKEMDLTPEEKEEIMQMIDQAKKEEFSGNKAKALVIYNQLLRRLKEIKKTEPILLQFTKPDGRELEIDFRKELRYWKNFYNREGVDWATLPREIKLSDEQIEALEQGGKALCPNGDFEKLKMLIIPANVADSGEKYDKLEHTMTKGYGVSGWDLDFLRDSGISSLENISNKLKIILVKDAAEIINDDVYQETLGLTLETLQREDGMLQKLGLRSFDMATYLIWQREYFKRLKKHPDKSSYVLLSESEHRGYLPVVNCESTGLSSLFLESSRRLNYHFDGHLDHSPALGWRLAKIIEIEDK